MLARLRLLLALPVLCLLAGCAITPHRVSYFDAIAAAPVDNVMRVYVDGYGSVYPREPLMADSIADYHWDGSLFNHFTGGNSPCREVMAATEVLSLCSAIAQAALGEIDDDAVIAAWYQAQEAIWRTRGQAIAKRAAANGQSPTIVFLVHGFNTRFSEAVPSFAEARRIITAKSANPQNLLFVETFWDGCSIQNGVGCWGQAQASGPLVGFFMRQMMNAMNEGLAEQGVQARVRMLSHSSGAFVIGSTLGNPDDVLPLLGKDGNYPYQRFAQHAADSEGTYRVPVFDDLAIGLLAPATTVKTFAGMGGVDQGTLSRGMRLLYGINPDDEVITKGFIGCSRFGITCMASNYSDYCDYLSGDELLKRRRIGVTAYDFKRDEDRGEHAFEAYLTQIETNTSFLADLMAPAGQMQRAGEYICPAPEAPETVIAAD
ncbi:MAG: hypothetical protein AAGL68_02530 [Pseudomonadota bacterium]